MKNAPTWTHGQPATDATQLSRPVVARVSEMPQCYTVAEHQHAWGQLAYAARGIMKVEIPGASYIIPPERALWLPKETPHTVSTRFGLSFRSLYIDNQWALRLGEQATAINVNPLLRELILQVTNWPESYPQSDENFRLLNVLIDQIYSAQRAPLFLKLPSDKRLVRISARLNNDPADNTSLQQWSEFIGATPRTLNRLFQKETHMGFVEWRQRLRILFSLEKVERGENIAQVAQDLGYESGSAFISMFKKHLGVSPKKYFKQSVESIQATRQTSPESAM
jgi:AraC-like DNA-binding protein